MGTFIINPRNLSSITCSLNEDPTVDYQVIVSSIDMNEKKRLEVLYAAGEFGGSVRKTRSGLVPVKFRMVIFGTTQAAAMANFRSVARAVTNREGGTIQYKPLGLGGSVLDTYYHYLQSPPPSIARRGHFDERSISKLTRVSGAGGDYGVVCLVELMTRAWATSDPDNPETLVASTTLDNYDDASEDNSLIVDSSDIKGDFVSPIIEVTRNAHTDDYTCVLYVHNRSMRTVANTNIDFLDSAVFTDYSGTWSTEPDAGVCGGSYWRTADPVSPVLQADIADLPNIDRTYFGKVAPVLCAKTSGEFTVAIAVGTFQGNLSWSQTVTIDKSDWYLYDGFGEIDFPSLVVPDYVAEADIDAYLSEFIISIVVMNRVSGNLDIDFLWLPKVDEWIARLETDHVEAALTTAFSEDLCINAFDELVYSSGSTDSHYGDWEKYGKPLPAFLLKAGYDSRLRFLFEEGDDTGGWDPITDVRYVHSSTCDFVVKGVHLTIFPFEVA